MTNQEILEKTVQRAIDGGWTVGDWTDADDFKWHVGDNEYEQLCLVVHGMDDDWYWSPKLFIFDHDFAKALWADDELIPARQSGVATGEGTIEFGRPTPAQAKLGWRHHLRQMVIAEDPIKYLGEHLGDGAAA